MINRHTVFGLLGCTMLAATAIAQTSAPTPAAPGAAPAPVAEAAKPTENNLAGQGKWRASKLMGVDIYGPDDKKVGDVTEVLFDKTGKVAMVTVGVGGFLGIGSKDVAIPFEQVNWSEQPMAATAPTPAPAPASSSGMTTTTTASSAMQMYPDHGKITMTKDQLSAAPSVTYTAR